MEVAFVFLAPAADAVQDIGAVSLEPVLERAVCELARDDRRHAAVHVLPLGVVSAEAALEGRVYLVELAGRGPW